ncbi:hypothetical protein CDL15_Pgr024892 [Punica granatum]|uniref:Uncharacterized protein n=1 Tax=Punica granatum TaxID=22663 RepID=A0A218W7D7_PUNGR|nr:hypothetical protein CDL15_Pgr024892 [Punica granatum]PKI58454.1 hypothetical protein CRG98_021139 [Punica granatum]
MGNVDDEGDSFGGGDRMKMMNAMERRSSERQGMVMSMMKLMASRVGGGGERQVMKVGGVTGVERKQRMKMVIAMALEGRCKGAAVASD